VDLDELIVGAFCTVDDALKELPAGRFGRQRGPAPVLADSEVLTLEVVGEFLGLDQDVAIYGYFRRHYAHFFPALRRVHRTTFVRQAANLWAAKEWLWQRVLHLVPHDPSFALVDSFPLPVCQFARAYRCRRFRGEAAFGKDILSRQTFYGFRLHVRLCEPGLISRFVLAPANVSEPAAVPSLASSTTGQLVGDRNYWAPAVAEELAQAGIQLLAPFRFSQRDPWPAWSTLLSRIRYRIDTIFGQLTERYHVKRVWARDSWHLWSRLLRKVLSHTLAVLLNQHAPERLQLACLLSQ
jgi:Transposase DDE domain